MLPIKKILFPSSFWGIFDFFVLFNNFGKRIKEYYVTMEERVLQTYKLKAQGQDWCSGKMILRENPPAAKGVKTQKQTVTRLVDKVCKCGW
jgi:hypothetical protein